MTTTRKKPSQATIYKFFAGAGDIEQQPIRCLRVLIEGLRTDPKKINRQTKHG